MSPRGSDDRTASLLCVGSVVADISIQGLPRFPAPEREFTLASDIWHEAPARLIVGGTAGNTALVYAELTGACGLAGVLGEDAMGRFLATALADRGVSLLGPRGGATATHTIAQGTDGRRQGFYFPGTPLNVDAVRRAWPGGDLYLSGINLCFGRPLVDGALALAQTARASGGRVVLDIGQGGRHALTLADVLAIAPRADVILGNAAEFEGLGRGDYPKLRPVLRASFAGPVVVKRGPAGVLLDGLPGDAPVEIPAVAVCAVNAVGAGDAFAAGFLWAWLAGADAPAACRAGNAAGAACVASTEGPQGIRRADVEALWRVD